MLESSTDENWFWALLLLYAGGQIKVSCYPFFDTANKLQSTIACDDNPPTSAYQKKGTSQHGGSREEMTNLAPIAIGVEFPDATKILSQFRARRKKSPTSLADIETILEILEVLTPEGKLGIMPP